MATGGDRFNDKEYVNWLRATLSLLYMKEGLEEFTSNQSVIFHKQLLKSLGKASHACKRNCSSDDIKKDFHNRRWYMTCPDCDSLLQTIISFHKNAPFPILHPANTHPNLWKTEPWEIMKLFIGHGCETLKSSKDADIQGILSLFINCRHFSTGSHIGRKDLQDELLGIRNSLLHSANFKVIEADMKNHLQTVLSFMQGMAGLAGSEKDTLQAAIDKVQKLDANQIEISVNKDLEVRALQERQIALDRDLRALVDVRKKEQDSQSTEVNEEINKLKAAIRKFNEFLDKNDLVGDVSKLTKRMGDFDQTMAQQAKRICTLEDQIQSKGDNPVASTVSWEDQCKDLQQSLIGHYRNTCLEVPNPAENNDIGLEYIYVNPEIRILRQSKGRDGLKNVKDEATSISCRKVFYNDEYLSRKIYITGDAGCGKSLLCKNIVRLWCEAHGDFLSNEALDSDSDSDVEFPMRYSLTREEQRRQVRNQRQQERKARREDNRQILSQFMFLFYITLRDSLSEYNVTDMIQSQILQYYDIGKYLCSSVLLKHANKCCLVIVDGLDEWVCPAGARVPHFLNQGLPGKDVANQNNVFLTTTRPWKFDILQLKSSEVDKHIELCAFDKKSASRLCSKVIKLVNESQSCKKERQEFLEILALKDLEHFKTIPVILVQLVCIWFDNQELGKSQIQLFCAMLDLLLKKSQKNLSVQTTNTPTSEASETPLPKCIIEHPCCQVHQQLIYCLSKVAFEALFDKTKENSLVFKSSQLEIYGVGQESIDMCLQSGILSQNKVIEKLSVSEKKMSFLHKRFQEFLAAVCIAICDNVHDIVKHITDKCSTLDTCLEMSQVWLFVSGIRPDITRQLLDHMTHVVTADKQVKHYRHTIPTSVFDPPPYLIRDIQTCVADCVIEGENNGHIYDNIVLGDFYIARNTACHVEHLLSCTPRSKVKSVYIRPDDIDSSQLTSITGQLQHCQSVQKMYLYDPYPRIDSDTVAQIINNNLDTLTCLHLVSPITATAELVSDICSISSKCVMAQRLGGVRLTHEHKQQILTRLSQSPTIRQLDLKLHCTDHGYPRCQTARIDLSTMTHIQRLELSYMSIDNLQSVSHCVERVVLVYVILPVTTLCEFARRLPKTRRDVTAELEFVTVTQDRESRVDVETLYQRVVTVTQDREPRVDVENFLRTCHGLKVTHCRYDESDNRWDIDFTTSSQ